MNSRGADAWLSAMLITCPYTRSHHWTPDHTVARHFNGEWSYNIGVYGNVFCLDKSTRSPSFMMQKVADQKLQMWKRLLNLYTSGARAKDSEGVTRMGLGW